MSEGKCRFLLGDALSLPFADKSIDLVFCSPPYEAARTYGIDFNLKGQAWVDWAVPRYMECMRVCKGLVAWVVEGQTRQYRYSATPALLMADLHRSGVKLRKPPIYQRHGIAGSGGPDWLANKYEFVVCASGGRLPWSENTACGHKPKYGAGGAPTHRLQNGDRVGAREKDALRLAGVKVGGRRSRNADGSRTYRVYVPPEISNPGNIICCGSVGGGHLGDDLAHENEAPFPEKLADFFIRSFAKPGGIVLDPFSGSGTTACVAAKLGRLGIGIDIRESQKLLGTRRATSCSLPVKQEVA